MYSNPVVAVLIAFLVQVARSTPLPDVEEALDDEYYITIPGRLSKDHVLKDRFAAVQASQLEREHFIESLDSDESDDLEELEGLAIALSEESEESGDETPAMKRHELLLNNKTPAMFESPESTASAESTESAEIDQKRPFRRPNNGSSDSGDSTRPPKFHQRPFFRPKDDFASSVEPLKGYFYYDVIRSSPQALADKRRKMEAICSRIFAAESLGVDSADAADFNEKMRRLEAICHRVVNSASFERHRNNMESDSSTRRPRPFKRPNRFRTTTAAAEETVAATTENITN